MVILIAFLIVAFGFYFHWFINEFHYSSIGEKIFTFFLMLAADCFILLIVCFVSDCTSECMNQKNKIYEQKESYSIVSLKDNQGMTANFYLFGGYCEDDLYYYYAEDTEMGIKTSKVKAEESYIIYDDDNPHIDKYDFVKFKKWWYYIYAFPMGEYYKIYVPSGTVTTEYKVDLE